MRCVIFLTIFEAGILSSQLNLIAYTSNPWTTYSISNSGLNAPRLVIEYNIEGQSLICEDGEVDLGWGDCNNLGNSLFFIIFFSIIYFEIQCYLS